MPEYKDSMGRYRTQSLFFETNSVASETPVFTLKPQDHKGYPSMKRLYLEYMDPTEYSFAIEVLGSWEHWLRLTGCDWFQEYITAWRDELDLKLRSEGVKRMRALANDGNKDAAKWLAEKGWNKRSGAGRPSKEEVERERKQQARIASDIHGDAARLGIKH